ncbi:alpha/beta hydrolase [Motiliproteus coralliicola]|uniref:Alpha/beta hydrolase n=1 Tax=Motiliproteus coralliicola TaxID=2283196 RepID=A0A369WUM7_9GAMM|nr:alpha/beta hydrolase [Motiliproteus coralliicola]RDE24769.1 alpha/beta hydrolase [Motiliproteus coralliicola]
MKPHFSCTVDYLELSSQHLGYRLYRNRYKEQGRRLLLLHGAGVAGEETWEPVVAHLHSWSEVLVPDLRGMGQTRDPNDAEAPFTIEQVCGDLIQLLDQVEWWAFDLGGYSFGGLVSLLLKQQMPHRVHKQYLVESALVDRSDPQDALQRRRLYSEVASELRCSEDPAASIMAFLNLVSPRRIASPRGDAISLERLGRRPRGFANALDAVTEFGQRSDRAELLRSQGDISSFVGGRTAEPMHQYNQQLEHQFERWHYHSVRGCDHSLPYQKPRQLAALFEQELERYQSDH